MSRNIWTSLQFEEKSLKVFRNIICHFCQYYFSILPKIPTNVTLWTFTYACFSLNCTLILKYIFEPLFFTSQHLSSIPSLQSFCCKCRAWVSGVWATPLLQMSSCQLPAERTSCLLIMIRDDRAGPRTRGSFQWPSLATSGHQFYSKQWELMFHKLLFRP